jgi:sulfur carrier protein
MRIQLNGEAHTLAPEDLTVARLVESLGLTGQRIAVEVNEEIVPRSQHGETRLAEGDRVEVVHAIGGG